MGRPSKWSPEFREEAVRLYRESEESVAAVARRLGSGRRRSASGCARTRSSAGRGRGRRGRSTRRSSGCVVRCAGSRCPAEQRSLKTTMVDKQLVTDAIARLPHASRGAWLQGRGQVLHCHISAAPDTRRRGSLEPAAKEEAGKSAWPRSGRTSGGEWGEPGIARTRRLWLRRPWTSVETPRTSSVHSVA